MLALTYIRHSFRAAGYIKRGGIFIVNVIIELDYDDLDHMLGPIIRQEPKESIFRAIADIHQKPIPSVEALRNLCHDGPHLEYLGYRLWFFNCWITDRQQVGVHVQMRTPRPWWHFLLKNRNRDLREVLMRLCKKNDPALEFSSPGWGCYYDSRLPTESASGEYIKDNARRAPLAIVESENDEFCFIEFQVNPV